MVGQPALSSEVDADASFPHLQRPDPEPKRSNSSEGGGVQGGVRGSTAATTLVISPGQTMGVLLTAFARARRRPSLPSPSQTMGVLLTAAARARPRPPPPSPSCPTPIPSACWTQHHRHRSSSTRRGVPEPPRPGTPAVQQTPARWPKLLGQIPAVDCKFFFAVRLDADPCQSRVNGTFS
jgi:hypothetical protein